MSGDVHAGFCERREVRSLPATHPILHCNSKAQAQELRDAIIERLAQVGLELNLDKTRIVYCKDVNRTGSDEHEQFTFLGYTVRPRSARNRRGEMFVSFSPAVSGDNAKRIGREIKRWRLHLWSGQTLADLAQAINPIVRACRREHRPRRIPRRLELHNPPPANTAKPRSNYFVSP